MGWLPPGWASGILGGAARSQGGTGQGVPEYQHGLCVWANWCPLPRRGLRPERCTKQGTQLGGTAGQPVHTPPLPTAWLCQRAFLQTRVP